MLKQKGSDDLAVNTIHDTPMLTQKGSNDLAVNTEHNTSMLTQKGSNDLAVNTDHNTSMLTQKGSYDLVVNTEHNTSLLTQKGSYDFAVNSEHDTSMLTQKGSYDLDHSEPKRPRIDLMQEKALKNNSSFVVWSTISARSACHLSFLSTVNFTSKHDKQNQHEDVLRQTTKPPINISSHAGYINTSNSRALRQDLLHLCLWPSPSSSSSSSNKNNN
ncbi:hypothetical protein DPMN_078947 [Dreissena polymorpha]|uniref:Uncharacterized protein n=1 Tax=Dreissena polymorpha TaxID=45954 RepID=A0A9D3YS55_DREPO|nr:hypothetical protein DPMN_078947 [Dreissena polymorpha]